jgi:uncharacterized delta-60 repeat protein
VTLSASGWSDLDDNSTAEASDGSTDVPSQFVSALEGAEAALSFVPAGPAHTLSLAAEQVGTLDATADVETYTLDLLANQNLSLGIAVAAGLTVKLRVTGPGSTDVSVVAASAGASAFLQAIPITTAGVYTITVESVSGAGGFTLRAALNGVVEAETLGGAANNTRATAQDLNGGWRELVRSHQRTVALGELQTGADDWYQVTFESGRYYSAVAYADAPISTFELYDSTGNLVSIAAADGIHRYNPNATGTYFLRVASSASLPYQLMVVQDGNLDAGGNDTFATAQRMGGNFHVGSLTATDNVDFYYFATITDNWFLGAGSITPVVGLAGSTNTLDVALELYNSSGTMIRSFDGGFPDGRNAYLNTIVDKGTYAIAVRAMRGTTGAYVIDSSGFVPAFEPFQVVAQSPPAGSLVRQTLDSLTVTFNESVDFTSITAGDLTINGVAATGVTAVSADTVRFTFAPPSNGQVNFAIAAGAVRDLERRTVNAFSTSVTYQLNQAPVLDDSQGLSFPAILEDSSPGNGVLVRDLLATGAGGDPISDGDVGDQEGIAVVSYGTTVWEYSLDGGATWSNMGAVSLTNARLLAADDLTRIRFVPQFNQFGTYGLSFRAWDRVTGVNGGVGNTFNAGGSSSYSTDIGSIGQVVTGVNDAPSFTKGADQVVTANGVFRSRGFWATNLSAGPDNEQLQDLSFVVTSDNPGLFSFQPTINGDNGTLQFTPKTGVFGTAVVSVRLTDNGGTANGGVDTSPVQTFTITTTAPPTITGVSTQTILEDGNTGPLLFTVGDPDSAVDSLVVSVFTSNSTVLPPSSRVLTNLGGGNYQLVVTPTPETAGAHIVTLRVDDGTAFVDTQFQLFITAVNDVPSFTKGPDFVFPVGSATRNLPLWATGISGGPGETSQTVTFEVTNDNNGLFSTQPTVASNGTLSFVQAAGAAGTAIVTVRARDNGGTANGGVDLSPPQTFTIRLTQLPTFSPIGPVTIDEEGTAQVDVMIDDVDSLPTALAVSAAAADSTLLPASGISVAYVGGNHWRLSLSPALNRFGSTAVTITAVEGAASANTSFTFNVSPVNDPPSFDAGPTVSALTTENYVRTNWATNISSGPNEPGQNPAFLLEVDDPTLFTVLPTVDAGGTLRFTGAGRVGTAQVTVRLRDEGGTGDDTSAPKTFEIRFTNQVVPSGQLDPTFDVDGARLIVSSMGATDVARDIARQSDGKFVVVGYSTAGASRSQAVVLRYNVDGTLDSSFGTGGRVLIGGDAFNISLFRLYSVEIAANGKIYVAGDAGTGYYVARLNTDGTFDATYGTGGAQTIPIPGNTSSFTTSLFSVGLALQADGRAIVTRYLRDSTTPNAVRIAVARLTQNGTLDTTFGGSGHRLIPWSGTGNDAPLDVVVQSDGNIVVAGTRSGVDFVALRLTSSGQLDTTFGGAGTGFAQVNVGATATTDIAYRVLLQNDGKILLGGTTGSDIGLVRLNADGTLDASFDGDGKAVINVAGADEGLALGLQSDGKIIVGGSTSTGGDDFTLVRLTSAGALDTSFDGDGRKTHSFGSLYDAIFGLVVEADGRIVVAGTATSLPTGGDVAVARFLADGALDTSFAGGVATSNHGLGSVAATRVIPLADGRMLVAGTLTNSSLPSRFGIWRLNRDGSLDATFGTGGFLVTDAASSTATGFALRSDGKLLLLDGFGNRIFRYTADGALDTTFGTAGVVSYASSLITSEAALALRPDDSFYVVGYKTNSTTTFDEMAIVRFTAAGAVDTSFDGDGVATVDVGVDDDRATAVALQTDGKIVVAGSAHNGTAEDFAIVRLNVDGSLDTSFSGDGKASTGASGLVEQFRSVLVDPDGKIVGAGISGGNPAGTANTDATLVRFTAAGDLDTTFSGDGIATANLSFREDMFTVLRQADGKLYVVGFAPYAASPTSQLAALRFNADGTLDTSFDGGDGAVTYLIGSSNTSYTSTAALDADGKLLIVSYMETQYRTDGLVLRVLTRPTAAAAPVLSAVADQTVAEDGMLTFTVTAADEDTPLTGLSLSATSNSPLFAPEDVTVTPLAGGQWSVTVRPGAGLFGFGGLTLTVSDGASTDSNSVAVNVVPVNDAPSFVKGADVSSGAGSVHSVFGWATSISSGPANESGQVLTFLVSAADPSLFDVAPAIDASGRLTFTSKTSASGQSTVVTVRLMDDGGIAAGGIDTSAAQTFVIQFTNNTVPSGILDPTFDADGVRTLYAGTGSVNNVHSIVLDDGRILVAATLDDGAPGRYGVWRLHEDGSLDTTFGSGGVVVGTLTGWTTSGFERRSDGKLVLYDGQGHRVARLTADGALDTAFGTGGVVSGTNLLFSGERLMALQSDDSILLVGYKNNSSTTFDELAVVRYTSDGMLDTSFGIGGRALVDVGSGLDRPEAVYVDGDDKIIIAAASHVDGNVQLGVARLNADGTLDTTFSGDGKLVEPLSTGADRARSIVVQPDGKIVIAGKAANDFFVLRYSAAGVLDSTFAGDGIFTRHVSGGDDAYEVMRQADGKLLVVGHSNVATANTILTSFRLLADGTLDVSFDGGDGIVTYPIGATDGTNYAKGALQPDGKLLAVSVVDRAGRHDALLLRYLTQPTTIDPPAVAGVYVRGSAWSTAFLDHLDAGGLGASGVAGAGYALSGGATQTTVTIPWSNINRITVRFDRDVTATLGSLKLVDSSGQSIAATEFRYLDGRTIEWSVPTLDSNKYLIHLDASLIAGIGGLPLDGEWSTGSTEWAQGSGDGSAGGDFNFRFNLLPADFDSSGSVAFGELGQVRLQIGTTTTTGGYNYRQDYDGSGSISFGDFGQSRLRLGTGLSGFAEPPIPDASDSTNVVVGDALGDAMGGVDESPLSEPAGISGEFAVAYAIAGEGGVAITNDSPSEFAVSVGELIASDVYADTTYLVASQPIGDFDTSDAESIDADGSTDEATNSSRIDTSGARVAAMVGIPAARFSRLSGSGAAVDRSAAEAGAYRRMGVFAATSPVVRRFESPDESFVRVESESGFDNLATRTPRSWLRLRRRSASEPVRSPAGAAPGDEEVSQA